MDEVETRSSGETVNPNLTVTPGAPGISVGVSWGECRTRPRNPADGEQWEPLDYGTPRGCGHVESACPECIGEWQKHYEIVLPCGCHADDVGERGHNAVIHAEALAGSTPIWAASEPDPVIALVHQGLTVLRGAIADLRKRGDEALANSIEYSADEIRLWIEPDNDPSESENK